MKKIHGGKRKGAGRPQTTEPTKTIRVPVSLLPKIEQIIKKHKSKPFHGFAELLQTKRLWDFQEDQC